MIVTADGWWKSCCVRFRVGLDGIERDNLDNVVIAYEPAWAVGTGRSARAQEAELVHGAIMSTLADRCGRDGAETVRINLWRQHDSCQRVSLSLSASHRRRDTPSGEHQGRHFHEDSRDGHSAELGIAAIVKSRRRVDSWPIGARRWPRTQSSLQRRREAAQVWQRLKDYDWLAPRESCRPATCRAQLTSCSLFGFGVRDNYRLKIRVPHPKFLI